MAENGEQLLTQLNTTNRYRQVLRQIIACLSFVVVWAVFWSLKLTGIGIAGEAFCGMEEHSHDDSCLQTTLICTLEEAEPHIHGESCLYSELICQTEEGELHTHEASCWLIGPGFGCGQTEADGHTHTTECVTEETRLACGQEAREGHAHTDACYEITYACQMDEHIHIESCYSDIHADLETAEDWNGMLADMVRGPTPRENVVLVAQSQLGYTESTLNFQVDAQGVRRGITRYGQWYGNPYGDWSAMFASFCLEYAGAGELPMNAGPEAMRLEWEAAGLYQAAADAPPEIGMLIFLNKLADETQSADAVAIVTGLDETAITVIEGDLDNAVTETQYAPDDPAILGYGLVPAGDEQLVLEPEEPQTGLDAVAPEQMVSAAAVDLESAQLIAQSVNYDPQRFTAENLFVVYTTDGADCYAFDGNGNAVLISIDGEGGIYADVEDPDTLLWAFTASGGDAYLIQNAGTGRYMHAYPNNGTGVTTAGGYASTLIESGSGVKIRSNTEYAKLDTEAGAFVMTQRQAEAAVYSFGVVSRCTVWLDGTDGGLGHLTGSPNTAYTTSPGSVIQLPDTWTSPSKYSYKLRGWYDVTNGRYYPAGSVMEVTGSAVLYADWVASTYDIGQFNAQVADTVSTNAFITTHMFDYNYLFNVHSANAQGTVNGSGHSESWSMVTSGGVDHGGQETFDFVFIDNDSGGRLCMPNNRSSHNVYPGSGIVTSGIYSPQLGELLFATDNAYDPATGTGVLGKTYLGTGDHLFQIMDDPADEHYGYYYYDSKRNAASYNQSKNRFYVYNYLAATSDAIGSTYSDFLPLNSPYANTNGKTVGTYNYGGVGGEYDGIPHYRYDSKYDSGNYNSVNNVQTDYAYGMRTDITFYLPNEPGSDGNKDLHGNDMQFRFSGDDDLWVLIDGQLVLDIGGIHGAEEGVIDFSTGEVTVQGNRRTSLMDLGVGAGDHTLSVLYLERGSSMSNCSIYFNLAPRFGLQLQKEDVLTQEVLNGAQFTVYEDLACTQPVDLWDSEDAYNRDVQDGTLDEAKSTFTVTDGVIRLWGLGSGNTYYIKETGPPAAEGYGLAEGVIRLTIEKGGLATYSVDVVADADGNEPSNGYTVHGVRIDETTKTVYLIVTNAPETVTETTTVQVIKKWKDTKNHGDDYIQAYLTVTDPDGTVRRIREITLSDENGWTYTWTNLPKYDYDALTEVSYGIEESYESGYYSTVRRISEIEISKTEWVEALSFVNGESYILKHSSGYLSTTSASDGKLVWVDEATAQSSPLALWTATVSNGKVKFTNGAGQILTFYYGSNSSNRYFYATTGSSSYQSFTPLDVGSGFRFYATRSDHSYFMSANGINSSGRIPSTTNSSSGLILIPMEKISQSDIQQVQDWAYQITNTPLEANNETSLSVKKEWNIPAGYSSTLYEEFAVTVRLYANGVNTGRSMTLNLKNNWEGSFLGLPYTDASGTVIRYTVDEVWEKPMWTTHYGEIVTSGGSPPVYSTTITNTYHAGGPELPSTGSAGRIMYVLCGYGIMLGSLVYGIGSRRRRERRIK